jgi:hypothetical protein
VIHGDHVPVLLVYTFSAHKKRIVPYHHTALNYNTQFPTTTMSSDRIEARLVAEFSKEPRSQLASMVLEIVQQEINGQYTSIMTASDIIDFLVLVDRKASEERARLRLLHPVLKKDELVHKLAKAVTDYVLVGA